MKRAKDIPDEKPAGDSFAATEIRKSSPFFVKCDILELAFTTKKQNLRIVRRHGN